MRAPILVGAAILGLVAVAPVRGGSVLHLDGTILCSAPHRPGQYSASCSDKTNYVLVTNERAFTIKHQNFSGLPQLVGSHVNVLGEISGRSVDIFQIAIDPSGCVQDE